MSAKSGDRTWRIGGEVSGGCQNDHVEKESVLDHTNCGAVTDIAVVITTSVESVRRGEKKALGITLGTHHMHS